MCSARRYAAVAAAKLKDDPNALEDALYELRCAQEDCASLLETMKERKDGAWMEVQRGIGYHAARAKVQP